MFSVIYLNLDRSYEIVFSRLEIHDTLLIQLFLNMTDVLQLKF